MKLEEETINSHELSRFYEWASIATEKYSARTNMPLLKKLIIDI